MKTTLLTLLLLFTLNSNASPNSYLLRKPLPSLPSHISPELGKIWDHCMGNADKITFSRSDTVILSNINRDCSQYGLNEIYFHEEGGQFVFSTSQNGNPFSGLRKLSIKLHYRFQKIETAKPSVQSNFIPLLRIDMRLNAIHSGVPYDYFISQRESTEGWRKIGQELISKETRTELCRPRIQCTYTISTYQQTWKSTISGALTVKIVKEQI